MVLWDVSVACSIWDSIAEWIKLIISAVACGAGGVMVTEVTEVPVAPCSSLGVAGWWQQCRAALALSRWCVRALHLDVRGDGHVWRVKNYMNCICCHLCVKPMDGLA